MTLLHAFQQHEYDGIRFIKWIVSSKSFDMRMSSSLALLLVALVVFNLDAVYVAVASALVVSGLALIEKDPQKFAKKALVLTNRAQRILLVECVTVLFALIVGIYVITAVFVEILIPLLVLAIIFAQALPLFFALSNGLLSPLENQIQNKILSAAKARLEEINPVVIGITGSYGKTSTKSILYHILSSCASALATPGSVNTLMGISRVIQENLSPRHDYFIVEMGAYGPGSIDKLCQLTPPAAGIITRIGSAHFERFKDLHVTINAKLELAESVLGHGGKIVVLDSSEAFFSEFNRRTVDSKSNDGVMVVRQASPDMAVSDGHILVSEERMHENGLSFTLNYEGRSITISAPVYGRHQIENIALAVTLSLSLGIEESNILAALQSLPQAAHRMEVKKSKLSPTLIDDAYNSNPEGFISALETLALLKSSGRAVLLTPGMVELGGLHDEEHFRVGQFAGEIIDVALLVKPERIKSFTEGLRAGGYANEIYEFDGFKSAWQWVKEHTNADDVILMENDLPDIYEKKLKI